MIGRKENIEMLRETNTAYDTINADVEDKSLRIQEKRNRLKKSPVRYFDCCCFSFFFLSLFHTRIMNLLWVK
jgi:hypothetical protein